MIEETTPPSSASRRSLAIRTLFTIIALALLIYLLAEQGWQEILDALRQIPLSFLLIAFLLMVISRLMVSARWHFLLRSAGVEISFWETIRITFAGLFASNFLPTTIGGDVVRLAGAIQLKFDAAICTASLATDRLVGMAGMAVVLPLGLPAFFHAGGFQNILSMQTGGFSSISALALFPEKIKVWLKKLMRLMKQLLHALTIWLKQPRSLLVALIFTWIHMLCLFLFLTLLFNGMHESISLALTAGLYSLVYFVTLLPISINGYGLQEISMTFVFTSVAHVSMSSALTAALLFRTSMMIVSLLGALFLPDILAGRKAMPQGQR